MHCIVFTFTDPQKPLQPLPEAFQARARDKINAAAARLHHDRGQAQDHPRRHLRRRQGLRQEVLPVRVPAGIGAGKHGERGGKGKTKILPY